MSKISVVIPARNEEKNLPKLVASLRKSAENAGVSFETVVVVNRSTDRTEEVARELGLRVVSSSAKNLSAIRNLGIRSAGGEIIITVDADNTVSENMFPSILRALENPIVGGGVLIKPERYSLGIIASMFMLLPVALYHRITAGLFFFPKSHWEAIQGFDESLSSAEDIDFAVRLKRYGRSRGLPYRNLLRASITTSCRKFDVLGDWYFVKNIPLVVRLLRGRSQKDADAIWYDFDGR